MGLYKSSVFLLKGWRGIENASALKAIFERGGEKYFHTLNVVCVEFCLAIVMNF